MCLTAGNVTFDFFHWSIGTPHSARPRRFGPKGETWTRKESWDFSCFFISEPCMERHCSNLRDIFTWISFSLLRCFSPWWCWKACRSSVIVVMSDRRLWSAGLIVCFIRVANGLSLFELTDLTSFLFFHLLNRQTVVSIISVCFIFWIARCSANLRPSSPKPIEVRTLFMFASYGVGELIHHWLTFSEQSLCYLVLIAFCEWHWCGSARLGRWEVLRSQDCLAQVRGKVCFDEGAHCLALQSPASSS